MNNKARQLGMRNTRYYDSTGLSLATSPPPRIWPSSSLRPIDSR
jgi:hypothetical protein